MIADPASRDVDEAGEDVPAFFRTRVIFHTHIEKTAGSSLINGFRQALGAGHVYDLRESGAQHPRLLTPSEKAPICMLSGHFAYGRMNRYFKRTPLYVACVRPPFERFRSYYNFIRPNHPAYAAINGRTMAEALEDYLDREHHQAANPLARKLGGRVAGSTEDIFRILDTGYLLVAPHHLVNDAVGQLLPLCGGRPPAAPLFRNKGPTVPPEEVGELEARFNQANSQDWDIYNYVVERYPEWRGRLEERDAAIMASQREAGARTSPAPAPWWRRALRRRSRT